MKTFLAIFVAVTSYASSNVRAETLDSAQAVSRAEEFVTRNGYTDVNESELKEKLDYESIERISSRDQLLKLRFNTLKPKAIGARGGEKAWSVGFDYMVAATSGDRRVCRVVTMKGDGAEIRMEHKDGFRDAFEGFPKQKK